ncbi:MAG: MFS transporter [Candidatus Aminicenantia bacterium]
MFLTYPSLLAFIAEHTQKKNQAQAFSLAANSQMLGGGFVVLVSGYFSDVVGINFPFIFLSAVGGIMLLYLIINHKKFKRI